MTALLLLYVSLFVVLTTLMWWDIKELWISDVLLFLFLIFTLGLKGLESIVLSFYAIFTLLGISLGLKVTYFWKMRQEGLGWGDVKFLALSGLWIPFESLPFFLILIGGIGWIGNLYWNKSGKGDRFPFGAVVAGVLIGWIVMEGIN